MAHSFRFLPWLNWLCISPTTYWASSVSVLALNTLIKSPSPESVQSDFSSLFGLFAINAFDALRNQP